MSIDPRQGVLRFGYRIRTCSCCESVLVLVSSKQIARKMKLLSQDPARIGRNIGDLGRSMVRLHTSRSICQAVGKSTRRGAEAELESRSDAGLIVPLRK